MAHALPLLKLSGLFIKTIAKPLTSYMKKEAPKNPRFSRFCEGIGQGVHSLFSRLNVLASGYKFVGVKPLAADEALVKGVEYISEFLVIGASTTIIMIEFTRSENKNAIKAAQAKAKEERLDLALHTRLACIEAGILGIESVLDRQARRRLDAWKAENMGNEIQKILQMNNVKLAAADVAEAEAAADALASSSGDFLEQSMWTVEQAGVQVMGAAQDAWGLVQGLWSTPPEKEEGVDMVGSVEAPSDPVAAKGKGQPSPCPPADAAR